MKSTATIIAATALFIAAAEAAPASVFKTKRTTIQLVADDCGPALSPTRAFATNAHGEYLVAFAFGDGCDFAKLRVLTDVYTELPVEESTVCFKDVVNSPFAYTPGANGRNCPLAFKSACTTGSFCQTWTGEKEGTACPTGERKVCDYPLPTHILYSNGKFESHFKQFQPPPGPISAQFVGSLVRTCPVYEYVRGFGYPLDKSLTSVRLGFAIRDPDSCDAALVASQVQAAVDAYKLDPAYETKPYPLVEGSYQKVAITEGQLKCFNQQTGLFSCRSEADTMPGCDIPCNLDAVCKTNNDCTFAKCLQDPAQEDPEIKICSSSAIASIIMPFVAATLALAFF